MERDSNAYFHASMQFSDSQTHSKVSQQRSWFGSPPIAHRNEKSPAHSVSPRSMHLALAPAAIMKRANRLVNCILTDIFQDRFLKCDTTLLG